MILVWKADTTSDVTYTMAKYADPSQVMGLKLGLRKPLGDRFPLVRLLVPSAYPPADFFHHGPMKIVSNRIKDILTADARVNAEFLPVEIFYRKKLYQERQFFFMNVLEQVDCFDYDNSEYSLDSDYGYIREIKKLVLRPVNTEEHGLFLIEISVPRILCITEDLAESILHQKCIGLKFIKPEEFKR